MNNKRKGFTVVELVIVIAVVAVLAAVVIPTFASIIKSTNISADTQAARNMNVILTAESSASGAPGDPASLIALLKENGITDFLPQTKFYTFYWIMSKNVIILADEGDRPVYPEEYHDATYSADWYALDEVEALPPPTKAPEITEEEWVPQTFTVTLTQSGSPVIIPFENIPTQATEGSELNFDIILPPAYRTDPMRYAMYKVTVIMHNGDTEHKTVIRSAQNAYAPDRSDAPFEVKEKAHIEIPYVTGNIEINVDVLEFSIVTLKCDLPDGTEFVHKHSFRKTSHYSIICDSLSESILRGYVVVSAKGFRSKEEIGELYESRSRQIKIPKELLFSDLEIIIEVEPKPNE